MRAASLVHTRYKTPFKRVAECPPHLPARDVTRAQDIRSPRWPCRRTSRWPPYRRCSATIASVSRPSIGTSPACMGSMNTLRSGRGGFLHIRESIKNRVLKPPFGLRPPQDESPDTPHGKSLPGAHRALAYALAAADGRLSSSIASAAFLRNAC